MLGLRLKEYARQAGIEKDISTHTLRATCATHCLRGKKRKEQMHPRYLMVLLGHNSMEALNSYLSVSIVDLKEAHQLCHPREKEAS
jgi:integrase/recombinase XerD